MTKKELARILFEEYNRDDDNGQPLWDERTWHACDFAWEAMAERVLARMSQAEIG